MSTRLWGPAVTIGAETIAAYQARVVAQASAKGIRVTADDRTLVAYVNGGRWVANCPHCNSGIAVHPDWRYAACLDCLHTYTAITFPSDLVAVEDALAVRPVNNQNCTPTETADQLVDENTRRGYGRRATPVVEPEPDVTP